MRTAEEYMHDMATGVENPKPVGWDEGRFSGPVYIDRCFAERVAKRVAELSNRSSPDDWPEAMLVTASELMFIINDELRQTPPEGAAL